MKPVSTPESLTGYLPFVEPSGSARESGDGESFEIMIAQEDTATVAADSAIPSSTGGSGLPSMPLVTVVAAFSPTSLAANVIASPLIAAAAAIEGTFGNTPPADVVPRDVAVSIPAATEGEVDPGTSLEQGESTKQAIQHVRLHEDTSGVQGAEAELSTTFASSFQPLTPREQLPESAAQAADNAIDGAAILQSTQSYSANQVSPAAISQMQTEPANGMNRGESQGVRSETQTARDAPNTVFWAEAEADGDTVSFAVDPSTKQRDLDTAPAAEIRQTAEAGASQPPAQPASRIATAAVPLPLSPLEAEGTTPRENATQPAAKASISGAAPVVELGTKENFGEQGARTVEKMTDLAITATDLPAVPAHASGHVETPETKAVDAPQIAPGGTSSVKGEVASAQATNTQGVTVTVTAPSAPRVPASPPQASVPEAEPQPLQQPATVGEAPEGVAPAGRKLDAGEDGDEVTATDEAPATGAEIESAHSGDDPGRSGVFALYEAASTATARPIGHSHVVLDQGATARHVSQQLSHAVAGKPDGTVELSLSPDELGQVKVILKHEDGGISVSIHAERQETLDLMRRHVDLLARDFREMGYTEVSFSFSDRRGSQQDTASAATQEFNSGTDAQTVPDISGPVPSASRRLAAGGLDLRM